MRQIDNMTSQEIETLKLKGMLAEKPTAPRSPSEFWHDKYCQQKAHAAQLAEALRDVEAHSYYDNTLQAYVVDGGAMDKVCATIAAYESEVRQKTHWEPLLGEVTDAQCDEATEAYYRDDLRDTGRNDDGSGESYGERNQ